MGSFERKYHEYDRLDVGMFRLDNGPVAERVLNGQPILFPLLQSSRPRGRHVSGLSPALALGHLPPGAGGLCPMPAWSMRKAAYSFRSRSYGSGIMGTVHDLMNEDQRHAPIGIPDGDLPKLGGEIKKGKGLAHPQHNKT
jgi:hypothetical protein